MISVIPVTQVRMGYTVTMYSMKSVGFCSIFCIPTNPTEAANTTNNTVGKFLKNRYSVHFVTRLSAHEVMGIFGQFEWTGYLSVDVMLICEGVARNDGNE